MINLYINLQIKITTMYYEEANIRKYNRKNKKGIETPYYQIRLTKDSKFNAVKPIALVDVAEIEELITNSDVAKLNEIQTKLNGTSEELTELKKEIEELKATNESLTSENKNLKEETIQLQADLLTEKDKNKKVIELDKYEAKVEELSKEKDLTKSLLVVRSDFLKQNALKRLFKVEPESSKIIGKIKELPEIVETESKSSEE